MHERGKHSGNHLGLPQMSEIHHTTTLAEGELESTPIKDETILDDFLGSKI